MSDKLPRVNSQQVVRALKRAGFEQERQQGSHLHLRRLSDNRRVIVPIHSGRDVRTGTLHAILEDAGLTVDEFRALL